MSTWRLRSVMRRYPLASYVILSFALSVALGLLLSVSILFGMLALFGPALAAFIVTRAWRGRAGVVELRAVTTRWRVHPGWYMAALGLPLLGFAIGHLLFVAVGNSPLPVPGAIQPILLVLFFLVIGEEIGWRGFLLRHLLTRHSPLVATLVVALTWALWHSPLYFIPGMPSYGQPFVAFAVWVIPISFLLTWLWLGTRSAWLATLMHGAANLAGSIAFPQLDAGTLFTFSAIGLSAVALPLVAWSWRRWWQAPPVAPVATPVPTLAGP